MVSNDDQQLTTVTLAAPAAVGRHTLAFTYRGKIETIPQGLFAQPYVKPGGDQGLLLSTQFESTDARRMFPCWDEPAFRATFHLSVTIPAQLDGGLQHADRAAHSGRRSWPRSSLSARRACRPIWCI